MKNIFVLIFCILTLNGCKKERDYRDKFLGNYNFTIHRADWKLTSPTTDTTIYTTYTYRGKVELGSKENTVLITFSEDTVMPFYSYDPTVYEEGSFQSSYWDHGEFKSTTEVEFSLENPGGKGYSNHFDVTGEKE